MNKRTKVVLFILGFLAIGQVLWWAHLLTDQQRLIAVLNPEFSEKSQHFSRMILSETIFFVFFWSVSLWYTYKNYKEQVSLKKAHGAFLGGISHELKTPIANIQLCIDTLNRPNIDAEKKSVYLGRAQTALNTLLEQVEDILTLTSLDSIQTPAEKISIKDLITDQTKIHLHNHNISSQNLFVDVSDDLIVNAPLLSSQLVVKSILDNAIKYSQKSKNKNIAIKGYRTGSQVVLAIKDHGMGMTKEEIEASMKPFWRSDRALEEALPGTGMGLTLAKEIAHKSQIQIRFDSEGINQGVEAKIIWEQKP